MTLHDGEYSDDVFATRSQASPQDEGRARQLLGAGLVGVSIGLAISGLAIVAPELYISVFLSGALVVTSLLVTVLGLAGVWGLYLRYHEPWLKVYVVLTGFWLVLQWVLTLMSDFLTILVLNVVPLALPVFLAMSLLKVGRVSSMSGLLTVIAVAMLGGVVTSSITLYIIVQSEWSLRVLALTATSIAGWIFSLVTRIALAYVYYSELRTSGLQSTSMPWA